MPTPDGGGGNGGTGVLSDAQLAHHAELKKNFCQASEMVAKLFLGHNQSYYNGTQAVIMRLREWVKTQEGDAISKGDLLRALYDFEEPPSLKTPQKDQVLFGRKRAEPGSWGCAPGAADVNPTQALRQPHPHPQPHPRTPYGKQPSSPAVMAAVAASSSSTAPPAATPVSPAIAGVRSPRPAASSYTTTPPHPRRSLSPPSKRFASASAVGNAVRRLSISD